MTVQRFDPEKDIAPMPFDDRICLRALAMKDKGLLWRPHVGCFVWDPDEIIKPASPFPGRIYFILSLARFIDIFGSLEQIASQLVWLPTRHQARLVCRQLGVTEDTPDGGRQPRPASLPGEDLLHIYGVIVDALKRGRTSLS